MFTTTILFLILGAFTWSFTEYAMHNWYGHLAKGRNDFSREHLAHHKAPNTFAPIWKKVLAASFVLSFFAPLSILAFGVLNGTTYSLSFIITYVLYEWLHIRTHTVAPGNPYTRHIYKHHLHHHFGSPKTNHGVTSLIWDRVFRTYQAPGKIRVPEKDVMLWLCDENGDIKANFRQDYVLIQSKTPKTMAVSAAVN
jgi:4-hydroxysphinganine ceramide fatty acyl 2-hydroxylase